MYYAMNVADAATFVQQEPAIFAMLVAPRLTKQIVDAEPGRFDGMATLFTDEPGTEAFIKVLRIRKSKSALRIYRSKTGRGGWERV